MALGRNRKAIRHVDYWPGFVDALSTLLLSIMFLLSVFVLAQFLLSQEITGKDAVLNRLNSQINELTQLLSLEQGNKQDLEDTIANLQASLTSAQNEQSRLQSLLSQGAGAGAAAEGKITELSTGLENEKQISARALSQVEILNQQIMALRKQIGALEEALNASESRDKESNAKIADLGKRLNVALAQRVQELESLPFRLFRSSAGNSFRQGEHPHSRRPFRLPVGSAVSIRNSDPQSGRFRGDEETCSCLDRLAEGNP